MYCFHNFVCGTLGLAFAFCPALVLVLVPRERLGGIPTSPPSQMRRGPAFQLHPVNGRKRDGKLGAGHNFSQGVTIGACGRELGEGPASYGLAGRRTRASTSWPAPPKPTISKCARPAPQSCTGASLCRNHLQFTMTRWPMV